MRCYLLIIKPQIALHHEVRCIVTCSVVRLCNFIGGFDAVLMVYVVWGTPLILNIHMQIVNQTSH